MGLSAQPEALNRRCAWSHGGGGGIEPAEGCPSRAFEFCDHSAVGVQWGSVALEQVPGSTC